MLGYVYGALTRGVDELSVTRSRSHPTQVLAGVFYFVDAVRVWPCGHRVIHPRSYACGRGPYGKHEGGNLAVPNGVIEEATLPHPLIFPQPFHAG